MQTTTTPITFLLSIASMNATSALHSSPSSTPSSRRKSSPPMSPSSLSASPLCFFSITNRHYKTTFLLSALTGNSDDVYLTIIWKASALPSEYRPVSWVHCNPLKVRKPLCPSPLTVNIVAGRTHTLGRVLQELRILARLEHRNIVRYYHSSTEYNQGIAVPPHESTQNPVEHLGAITEEPSFSDGFVR
jgi:hypothetical protein